MKAFLNEYGLATSEALCPLQLDLSQPGEALLSIIIVPFSCVVFKQINIIRVIWTAYHVE